MRLGGQQPGVDDGEVGGDDGQEEQEEADDLGDVEGVVGLENKGQNDKGDDSEADDDTCNCLGPGPLITGKHLGSPFDSITASLCRPFLLDAATGVARYQYGSVGRAEAVVYIYYGDVGGAGVEHSQKRGGAVEAGAVADRGGDGDDGDADEAADDGGKSAFHAGADDDDVGVGELLADREKAMDAGYADVVEAGDFGVEEFGGDGGLFGDGLVAGAGGEDGDVADGLWRLGIAGG